MVNSRFKFQGKFIAKCYDKNGNFKWKTETKNLVVNEALNHALDSIFHATTQITTWYVGLFESDTTILATYTYASPGFTECTAYSQSTRPEYNEAAAASQSITNSANKAQFSMNATKTIYGAFLVGGGSTPDTKGDTSGGGTLWCAAQFISPKDVNSGDTVEITYTLTSADDGV